MSKEQQFQKIECRVCLQTHADASIDGCQHRFCLKCIRKWAKRKNTCPLCRAQFVLIRRARKAYRVTPPPQPPVRHRPSLQNTSGRVQPFLPRILFVPLVAAEHLRYYFFVPAYPAYGSLPSVAADVQSFPTYFAPS